MYIIILLMNKLPFVDADWIFFHFFLLPLFQIFVFSDFLKFQGERGGKQRKLQFWPPATGLGNMLCICPALNYTAQHCTLL